MKIEIYGELIECGSVIKGKDSITVLDENGGVICEASGISDFSGYVMIEGEWTEEQPEPTDKERIAALEEQVAQADETAIELYEMQMAQEEINAAQDDALIEIYEMIGG